MGYKPIIGLEVHVELKTKSKMFCGCSADYFGKDPNTHVCPACLGLPGALPVPNKKAVEWCVMIGLALNCKIPLFAKFDRKNYFYPDLPKGYQISQYDRPFCANGYVILNSFQDLKTKVNEMPKQVRHDMRKPIRIKRVHMEEDTGKLLHISVNGEKVSLIDFNRSGVPLVEIVTEPDFRSATEVVEYLKKLQQIVRYLEVSDADMEKGEMRLEPNVSLRSRNTTNTTNTTNKPITNNLPQYKVEVKNINSFRFVEKAINYEIKRQKKILESGETPIQETRGWDSEKQITVSQRAKEEVMDYRYFPEPDIPPIRWKESQISNLKSQIPELPDQKSLRFKKYYGLSQYQAQILTTERTTAEYFEEAVKANRELRIMDQQSINTRTIANWIINKKVDIEKTAPSQIIKNILESTKTEIIEEKELEKIIDKIIIDNSKAISDYRKGRKNAIMFLLGQVMKKMQKKVDVNIIRENLEKKLNSQ